MPKKGLSVALGCSVQADETGLCRALSLAIHPFSLLQVHPIGKIDDDDDAGKVFSPHAGINM
jgi:hypothetical protein